MVGRQSTLGVPFRFASVDSWIRSPAPRLGQHNAEILRELGHDDEQIAQLAAEKVIGDWPDGIERK